MSGTQTHARACILYMDSRRFSLTTLEPAMELNRYNEMENRVFGCCFHNVCLTKSTADSGGGGTDFQFRFPDIPYDRGTNRNHYSRQQYIGRRCYIVIIIERTSSILFHDWKTARRITISPPPPGIRYRGRDNG